MEAEIYFSGFADGIPYGESFENCASISELVLLRFKSQLVCTQDACANQCIH